MQCLLNQKLSIFLAFSRSYSLYFSWTGQNAEKAFESEHVEKSGQGSGRATRSERTRWKDFGKERNLTTNSVKNREKCLQCHLWTVKNKMFRIQFLCESIKSNSMFDETVQKWFFLFNLKFEPTKMSTPFWTKWTVLVILTLLDNDDIWCLS